MSLRKRFARPVILETHCGRGHVFERAWPDVESGIACDTDVMKCEHVARQRPTWSVYQCKVEDALAAGAGTHLEVNILDVDPYGEPWPTIEAFFTSERPRAAVLGLAVNDGLRQKLRLQGGWHVHSLRSAVEKYGNADLFDRYLEVCRWKAEQLAGVAGYRLAQWSGYYCGNKGDMTHYAAVFKRRGAPAAKRGRARGRK